MAQEYWSERPKWCLGWPKSVWHTPRWSRGLWIKLFWLRNPEIDDFTIALSDALSPSCGGVSKKLDYLEKAEIQENFLCPIRIFEMCFLCSIERHLLAEIRRNENRYELPLGGISRFAHNIPWEIKFSDFGYPTTNCTNRFWYYWANFEKINSVSNNSAILMPTDKPLAKYSKVPGTIAKWFLVLCRLEGSCKLCFVSLLAENTVLLAENTNLLTENTSLEAFAILASKRNILFKCMMVTDVFIDGSPPVTARMPFC